VAGRHRGSGHGAGHEQRIHPRRAPLRRMSALASHSVYSPTAPEPAAGIRLRCARRAAPDGPRRAAGGRWCIVEGDGRRRRAAGVVFGHQAAHASGRIRGCPFVVVVSFPASRKNRPPCRRACQPTLQGRFAPPRNARVSGNIWCRV
jgi:hypothetical protein